MRGGHHLGGLASAGAGLRGAGAAVGGISSQSYLRKSGSFEETVAHVCRSSGKVYWGGDWHLGYGGDSPISNPDDLSTAGGISSRNLPNIAGGSYGPEQSHAVYVTPDESRIFFLSQTDASGLYRWLHSYVLSGNGLSGLVADPNYLQVVGLVGSDAAHFDFSDDGSYLTTSYGVSGSDNNRSITYQLSTPWDVSTRSTVTQIQGNSSPIFVRYLNPEGTRALFQSNGYGPTIDLVSRDWALFTADLTVPFVVDSFANLRVVGPAGEDLRVSNISRSSRSCRLGFWSRAHEEFIWQGEFS